MLWFIKTAEIVVFSITILCCFSCCWKIVMDLCDQYVLRRWRLLWSLKPFANVKDEDCIGKDEYYLEWFVRSVLRWWRLFWCLKPFTNVKDEDCIRNDEYYLEWFVWSVLRWWRLLWSSMPSTNGEDEYCTGEDEYS